MPDIESTCANCNTVLQGDFCHECGERKPTKRDKRISHFLEETFAAFFFADGKFPQTIKLLVTRPGTLPRKFMQGVRKKYLSPIQLFFFANLVYFLIPLSNTFDSPLQVQLNQLPHSRFIKPMVEKYLEDKQISYETYAVNYNAKSTSNSKMMLIIMVVLQGIMMQLLFLRKKEFYLIDFLATAAYFLSFIILILLVLFPALLILLNYIFPFNTRMIMNDTVLTRTLLTSVLLYTFFMFKNGFRTSIPGGIWRSVAMVVLIVPSLFIYRYLLFWVTFWMTT